MKLFNMLSIVLLYLLLLLAIFLFQRKLIYFPETYSQNQLPELLSQYHLKPWPDEKNIRGFISRNELPHAKGSVLIFHGNAGSARGRLYYIEALEQLGYRVILAEYPGYGSRSGQPSESVFIEDSLQTALLAQAHFNGPMFLWGESLGAGVVSGIVKTGKIKTKGIILMTPFDSLASVAQHHYWFFLGKWLTRDKFNNVSNLKHYSGNTAVILAEQDEIIPKQNTLKLYESITGRKQIWKFAESGHNTLPVYPDSLWWAEVMQFVDYNSTTKD
jgi:pimeloyl-ACP methyl ester carboxylesterase